MSVPANLNIALKKRPGGQIVNMLDWAISGGPAKWCDDVTHSADKTLTQTYVAANSFTINSEVTLTLTQLRPLIVVADTITISGTITASGKGCSGGDGSSGHGYRYTGFDWPFWITANEATSQSRNYCLCGAGGGAGLTYVGGGAYGNGGNVKTAGANCDLIDAELKELLFSPLFDISQIGFGGGGGTRTGIGGAGGGAILLIGSTIVVNSSGKVLANGINGSDASYGGGGGGGGFVGLIGDSFDIHPSSTITANGGTGGEDTGEEEEDGGDGGNGTYIKIEV